MPHIKFQQLAKTYGKTVALEKIDLSIERGSVLALLGPNGAGKSTLFGCLLGLVRPTSGSVLLNGKPVRTSGGQAFGYMPERVTLYPHCSVLENARFFARLKGQSLSEVERQLKRVGLFDVRSRAARELSKGMLQRLGLAIALCGSPELLVLDEPFNGLDPALLQALQRILAEESARGATLLISTHTMSAVEPLATAAAILFDGRLAAFIGINELRERFGELSLEQVYHRIAIDRTSTSPTPLARSVPWLQEAA